MQRLIWCVLLLAFAVTVQAKVVTKEVNYSADGLNLKGYLAYDDAQTSKRPGVLVVHEWWGQNDYIRKRAHMLAELGYVALALDMYGDGKQAAHPEDTMYLLNILALQILDAVGRIEAWIESSILDNEDTNG